MVSKTKNAFLLSLILVASVAFLVSSADAREIIVDPSWMADGYPTLINNIMDGDPETFGKDGETDAVYGDTISFASGTYELPMDRVWFVLKIDGVDIKGAGWDNTILKGPNANTGFIFEIKSSNNTFSDLKMEGRFIGALINGENYENINFSFLKTNGFDKHITWDNQYDESETLEPTIWLENVYMKEGSIGIHFAEINGTRRETKFLGGSHLTLDGVTVVGIDAPVIWENQTVTEMKGNDHFSDSIIVNSQAEFFPDTYNGMGSPWNFIAHEVVEETMADRGIGKNNIEDNPMLDSNGRPRPGSPAIGRQYKDGYAGAVPPHFTNVRATKRLPVISVREIGGLIIPFLI